MNLLFMANNGLPKNGLVALYDPYRDTYGRNILPVGSDGFVTRWVSPNVTANASAPDADGWRTIDFTVPSPNYYRLELPSIQNTIATVGSMEAYIVSGTKVDIANAGDIAYTLTTTPTKYAFNTTYSGGGAYLGFYFNSGNSTIKARFPQINLGALYPYSPPAGLPQSLTDYTGHANNAQLGSTAGADTNDPKYNGVALVGDGVDDYAVVPLASAAYRISVVDSGSGYVVVDEVPAYLNLFKTGASTYLNGKIAPAAYYNRVPTASEIAQAKRYFKRLMAGRGVTVS